MVKIKEGTMLAISLILIGIWILTFILGMTGDLLDLIGIMGSTALITSEVIFLWRAFN